MKKAKSCSGCPAFSMNYCTLGYKTEVYEWWGGSIPLTRPVVCCNKPKTVKEYYTDCATWEEAIAGLINKLWQSLTEEEKQQVKGILE